MRRYLTLAFVLSFLAPALAGVGAGELALDRGSVAALIAASTPGPRTVTFPGVGAVTVALRPPSSVSFVDGGVEALIRLSIVEIGLEGPLQVRMEPRVREDDGVVQLVATRVVGQGALGMLPDLAQLVRPVELPRQQTLVLEPRGGRPTRVYINAQRVRVTEDRLVFEFGVATKPLEPGEADTEKAPERAPSK